MQLNENVNFTLRLDFHFQVFQIYQIYEIFVVN